jgi:hypothetical protein
VGILEDTDPDTLQVLETVEDTSVQDILMQVQVGRHRVQVHYAGHTAVVGLWADAGSAMVRRGKT